jgi:glucose dehydrogenase
MMGLLRIGEDARVAERAIACAAGTSCLSLAPVVRLADYRRLVVLAVMALMLCFATGAIEPTRAAGSAANLDAIRIGGADQDPANWVTYGRTYSEQRFSPLARITADNVQQLGLAWYADFDTNRGQEATPLIIDGVMYVSTAWSKVRAFDAKTGRPLWSYDPKVPRELGVTVPGDPSKPFENDAMAMAAKAWHGEFWKLGGGGTVWDSIYCDPALNLIYFGVGNGAEWNQGYRSASQGDNLFLSSIVALNADTGAYVWHYQATPGEEWDYDAVQQLILADLSIDGAQRQVLMQANKNGFFYVLDRKTGQLISANASPVTWASGIDLKTGRRGRTWCLRCVELHRLPW